MKKILFLFIILQTFLIAQPNSSVITNKQLNVVQTQIGTIITQTDSTLKKNDRIIDKLQVLQDVQPTKVQADSAINKLQALKTNTFKSIIVDTDGNSLTYDKIYYSEGKDSLSAVGDTSQILANRGFYKQVLRVWNYHATQSADSLYITSYDPILNKWIPVGATNLRTGILEYPITVPANSGGVFVIKETNSYKLRIMKNDYAGTKVIIKWELSN